MKRLSFALLLLVCSLAPAAARAQSKIKDGSARGTSVFPNSNAILELESQTKGFLLPRVGLKSTLAASPLSAHVVGITVYNTATAGNVSPGFYYNDGAKWVRLANADNARDADPSRDAWIDDTVNNMVRLNRQSDGTSHRKPNTDFIISDDGKSGIGTATPQNTLHLNGTFQLTNELNLGGNATTNGSPGNKDEVIVSNGPGTAPSWQPIAQYGDVKQSFKTADHSGWILLDGRATTTLTSTQRTRAAALGFPAQLPDADNRTLKKKGVLGATGGSDTVTLLQDNLPDVTFTGTTNIAGEHLHSFGDRGSSFYNNRALSSGTLDVTRESELSNKTEKAGNHSHTVSVSSGGNNMPLSVADPYLSVNAFIYLGS